MKKLNMGNHHLQTKFLLSKQISEFEKRLIISKKQIQMSSQAQRQHEENNKIGVLYAVQAIRENNAYNANLNNAKAQYSLLVRKYQSSVQGCQPSLHNQQQASHSNNNRSLQKDSDRQEKINKSVEKLKIISARSFVVICSKTNQIIYGRRVNKQREMASLTKIMTLYISLRLIEKLGILPSEYEVKISKKAVSYKGTSAGLKPDDTLSLLDLLYAMMLPSGNDAAYAIAECIGRLIHDHSEEKTITSSAAVRAFLDQMNRTAEELQLESTTYVNPHGLANAFNVSTALSIATLVQIAMQNELFCTIVKTSNYRFQLQLNRFLRCKITNNNLKRDIYWENTNKLLNKNECLGVKTGYTPTAGPCFASIFEIPNISRRFIIVLLKTDNQEERFSEALQLYEFVKLKFGKV